MPKKKVERSATLQSVFPKDNNLYKLTSAKSTELTQISPVLHVFISMRVYTISEHVYKSYITTTIRIQNSSTIVHFLKNF